MTLLFYQKSGT